MAASSTPYEMADSVLAVLAGVPLDQAAARGHMQPPTSPTPSRYTRRPDTRRCKCKPLTAARTRSASSSPTAVRITGLAFCA